MRVVVTRPQPQAAETAVRLRERGHEAIILPLTEIVALSASDVDLAGVDCVAVTSANALRYAEAAVLARIKQLPLFAVGDRTADEARKAGFAKVWSASGDVEALAPLVLDQTIAEAKVVYLCGRTRRPEFETALRGTNRAVLAVETYETRVLALEPDAVAALKRADAVLVYAQSAAHALYEIGVSGLDATFICMSNRVARALRVPTAKVRMASQPDEASMLAEIDRLP